MGMRGNTGMSDILLYVAASDIGPSDRVSKGHHCCPIFRNQLITKTIECKAGCPRRLWKAE